MDEMSMVETSTNNLSENNEWWPGILEDEQSFLFLNTGENSLWSGNFLPPPPRPLFLEEAFTYDCVTTCDFSSWPRSSDNPFSVDIVIGTQKELGWVVTLITVSFISAFLGAAIMVMVLHCRRIKNAASADISPTYENVESTFRNEETEERPSSGQLTLHGNIQPPLDTPGDKEISVITHSPLSNASSATVHNSDTGIWSWLSHKSLPQPPLLVRQENHHNHMRASYSCVNEGIYAEVDQESAMDMDSNNLAYQNTAYTDLDAPSSAYYSDLSTTPVSERTYEVVGLVTLSTWEGGSSADACERNTKDPIVKLAIISENTTVTSDYV